jgi:3-phenylpropionate/cinnamic acid dioxygenase small subunit
MGHLAEMAAPVDSATLAQIALQHEVEQFLYHEAALIDDRKHWEWYALLADDLEYWMPVRSTRARGDEANEFAPLGGAAFFDEDKHLMAERIRKLDTPYSWSEDPPSRCRHFVSNVRIAEQRDNGELLVHVNFLIYRSRLARDEDMWAGRREDTLRRVGDSFQIVKRHIFVDQVSLMSKNLSIFF